MNACWFVALFSFSVVWSVGTQIPCDRTRRVLTQPWGLISDGPPDHNYTQGSHCQWLIKANTTEQFITLRFRSLVTECAYDYVYVYDGDSFESPMLGSFSGKTEPQEVVATSGFMLILLYSDTNYVLDGFTAEYSITECPKNCSGRGVCVAHRCICEREYGGVDCEKPVCDGCTPDVGICDEGMCRCHPGRSGHACSLFINDTIGNKWHSLYSGGFSPRAAHTAIYIKSSDSLYVFGGYDLNYVLGDLLIFRFNTSQWEDDQGNIISGVTLPANHLESKVLKAVLAKVSGSGVEKWGLRKNFFQLSILALNDSNTFAKQPHHDHGKGHSIRIKRDEEEEEEYEGETMAHPSARYGHAAAQFQDGFAVYGGKLDKGVLSDELWYYNITTNRWSLRAVTSNLRPPALARHTLTLTPNGWLYLLGGSLPNGLFSSQLWRIKLVPEGGDGEQWELVKTHSGKELDLRLVGHTTVYYSLGSSDENGYLLVHGGISATVARFSKLSDKMYSFHLQTMTWALINYPRGSSRDTFVPAERAFHSAIVIGNYLAIFGGYTHRHNKEEICYDNQLYLYHLGCHTWVSHEILGSSPESKYLKKQGIFSHAAAVRNGNTMLLVGGYHGNVNSDLLAFTFPPTLASLGDEIHESETMCARHHGLLECTSDPECGWCSADEVCYGRTLGVNCTTNLQTTRCPGICPALSHCHACLLQGGKSEPPGGKIISVAQKLALSQCTWCIHNAKCHHIHDNFGVCGVREDTPSQGAGWWGEKGVEVTSPQDCKALDKRPGLTFIKYKHPANFSQPDFVSIINSTVVEFSVGPLMFGGAVSRMEQNLGGFITARLRGFLRPPTTWKESQEQLRTCITYSSATLSLGVDPSKMQTVTDMSAELQSCYKARWINGDYVFLHESRYALDFQAQKAVNTNHAHSHIEIQHNKTEENAKVFTFEYLEPYEGLEDCNTLTNCLACLTDSKCGWCPLTKSCLNRQVNETLACRSGEHWHYLTLDPHTCENCSNFITCNTCINSGLCEWWADDARCYRKGRSSTGIKKIEECPMPCYTRSNCSQCLDGNGKCVWCQATQECFSFSVYTSQYQFGLCREWSDQSGSSSNNGQWRSSALTSPQACQPCSTHSNCSTCLKSLGCGWCYNVDNPIQGVCAPGDFSTPHVDNCSNEVNARHHTSLYPDEAAWSYAQCPDVDECGLGLHDCHAQAKCTNTHGSYNCQCKRGYYGDGKDSCIKTCYNKCIHGYCSNHPDYVCQCNLGWTGPDCSINCGCNNHSTCTQGVNICDSCQDWTTGEFCQFCKPGSYGNATSPEGCKRCNCNEHGNQELGVCDSQTGLCVCQDNTEGATCDKCKKGYYGDPRRGGTCYYQCMSRGMVSSMKTQGLGSRLAEMSVWESRQGPPPTRECLWIISPDSLNQSQSTNSIIQLEIDRDIEVGCTENSVYVYDGLPKFVSSSGNHQSHVLGVFCTQDSVYPVTVQAKSGVMTVHYKSGGDSRGGFNATVSVLSCPDHCLPDRICIKGSCVCPEGKTGYDCKDILCPNNCSAEFNRGICDKGYGRCLCSEGWGGSNCSVPLNASHQIIFTELFNSVHLADSLEHLRKMLPRFGHSLLADKRNSLWLFGGYSLSHGPLNDIRLFDTKNNTWMQVTIDSTNDANMPRGRYFHAAEISFSRREIFIHGGLTAAAAGGGEQTPSGGEQALRQNTTLNDFWKFSLKNQHWVGIETNVKPPGLAGHTLTLRRHADSETLVLIGGFNPDFGFMDSVWEYDPKENEWRKIVTLGYHPIGVYGHSTVYHEPTQSFYVFGGYVYGLNRTYISDKLFALHYPSRTWTALPTFPNYNPPRLNMPRARFLHSAVTTDEYMLVFGGRTEPEASSETLIAYSYACNHWFKLYSRGMDIVGEMPPDTYAHSMTLDIDESTGSKKVVAYIMGGFTGGTDSHVTRISLPDDLCSVWSTKEKCRLFLGCTYCSLSNNGIMNSSHCYKAMNARDTSKNMSNPCGKHGQTTGTTTLSNGQVCGADWLQERACKQFTTCTDCLARFPMAWDGPAVCKWCPNCGKCISVNTDCKDEKCDNTSAITIDTYCPEMSCAASDCDKCSSLAGCSWTRLKSYEAMSPEPIYDWSCTEVNRTSKTRSETSCPKRCSQYTDCHSCLQSYGGEGNWDECRWSTRLSECISPSYQPLVCAGGVCGLVLNKGAHCPQPCATFDQCSECLRHAHCGWCSLQSTKTTGMGVCSEGSLDQPAVGPEMGTCEALYSAKVNNTISNEMKFSWHYVNCPYENECENGHHNCDRVSESCVDLPNGYQCTCGPGYKPSGEPHKGECIPVCSQGCVRGRCTSPDTCSCDFGYVGANCSIQCQCNGHSHCAGPDKLDECLECKNNTQGPTCGRCKPLFVGDPSDNGECIPCSMFCNEHSSICVNETLEVEPEFFIGKTMEELELFLVEGPTTKAKCIGCSNMTTGDRCEECITGHFRGSEDHKVACQPCQCHGHGSTCNPVTGEGCDCHNNTESDPTCSGKSHSCWEVQCSKCKESYMGIPTRGHQCYKQMTFDLTFSLGAKLVDDSGVKPTPLNPGQASFFAVQPRFMNVDIRITVDVTQGSLDLYLSPKDDVFTVELNTTTYAHVIKLDDRYWYRSDDARQFLDHFGLDTWFRPLSEIKYIERNTLNPLNFKRRPVSSPINVFVQSPEGLSAHITLKDNNSLLIARNITDRLVITLPYETHSLNQAKFYIVLVAINKPTYGTVFFRQDQLHIDLFVFFSVFFSCFFLFLAACVVAWKAKQATDMRRARRRHVVEMLHMAKRPFAGVSVLLEPSPSSDFSLRPVAIEPTHDSLAAVTTVFVTLPGGGYAPSRLAIASALVLINRGQSHGRAFLRRRSSHS